MITYNELPKAISEIQETVNSIERLLVKNGNKPKGEADKLLTVTECADFLNLAVPTIYSLVSRSEIPNFKKTKRLYFSKQQLTDWIKKGRRKTIQEIDAEADNLTAKK